MGMVDGPVVIFDSGFGGLSVVREIRRQMPAVPLVYVADDAAFPYGDMDAERLKLHVMVAVGRMIDRFAPAAVVIACNTASTLVLDPLRAAHDLPFVGTVPAIKPAAELSRSGLIAVLATPATIERDYTRDLISQFAATCHVRLVGAPSLAEMAEVHMLGIEIDRTALWSQIAPCFYELDNERVDVIALACTHYPFLVEPMNSVTPWPVAWVDPAAAIARRLSHVTGDCRFGRGADDTVLLTSGRPVDGAIGKLFRDYGFSSAGLS